MGIAEHMAAEHLQMLLHLAFGIESPSGVVQIHMLLGIQARILPGAKRIKELGGIEGREGAPKGSQGHFHSRRWRGLCIRHKTFSFWEARFSRIRCKRMILRRTVPYRGQVEAWVTLPRKGQREMGSSEIPRHPGCYKA